VSVHDSCDKCVCVQHKKTYVASSSLHYDSDSVSWDFECEPCEDPDAFPDHWHQAKKHGKRVQVLNSRVDANGGLRGGCDNMCKRHDVDMAMFAPAESTNTNGARQTFLAALDAFAEAWNEEATQIHQWPCLCCHMLEPTSNTGKINNPDTMKHKPNETDREFRDRQAKAVITFPKYEYVNTLKGAIGACQYPGCGRNVFKGNEASFHYDHRVESEKRKCRCLDNEGLAQGPCHGCVDREFGRGGGVGGLASNGVQATALEYVKELIDTEAAPEMCDLLCVNCHVCRKPHGIERHEEFVRPAPRPRRQLLTDDRNVKRRAYEAAKAAKRKRAAAEE
jgi:hypothetical protein